MKTRLAPADERLWLRVDVDGPPADLRPELGPCWLWRGNVTALGYALVWWKGSNTHAHRVTWGLAWGHPVPKGLRLEHFACTRPACVNPHHVRPKVAVDTLLGARNVVAWNERHGVCIRGHVLGQGVGIPVPGGVACRICRNDVARERKRTGRSRSFAL